MTEVRRHPIQAVKIRVESVSAGHRARREGDDAVQPTTHLPKVRLASVGDDRRSFSIEVRSSVSVPLLEDQVWLADIRISATFTSDIDITRSDAQAFARASGVFLVWPYARTYLSELAAMADVSASLPPLLSRPQGT